jgi:hypothetical protein
LLGQFYSCEQSCQSNAENAVLFTSLEEHAPKGASGIENGDGRHCRRQRLSNLIPPLSVILGFSFINVHYAACSGTLCWHAGEYIIFESSTM